MEQIAGVEALQLTAVSKSFPGVRALTDVNLTCRAGEIHALVGENGSGKSTLIKIACGALPPDSGTVTINGTVLSRPSPFLARQAGIVAAYQDTSLVPDLSVTENILLSFSGQNGFNGVMDRERAQKHLEPFGLPIPPEAIVAQLSPAMRQLLEVVRAMMHRPAVLVLDEPTAALDADTIGLLQGLVLDAKRRGTAILYISHHLEEIQKLADRVTVLRDGVIRGTYDGGASVDEIVTLMVGGAVDLNFPVKPPLPDDAPVALSVDGLYGARFGPVELSVRAGEIVGIAGAEGNGQRELVRGIVGLVQAHGEMRVGGREVKINSPAAALQADISFQSGDRVAESIFTELSVMSNSTLPAIDQLGELATVQRRRERSLFMPAAQRLGIVAASPDQPIGGLSGGNQQKAVLARAMLHRTRVLIIDEPTQGVDARARTDIYHALRELAADGKAVLVNSSDSMELAGLCDRVYVMSRGKVVDEVAGDDLSESRLIRTFVAAKADLSVHEDAAPIQAPRAVTRLAHQLAKPWMPLLIITLLMLIVGAYAETTSSVFLGKANLSSIFVLAIPLAIVSIGQQIVLITGGFDISVGAMMSLAVVLMSFWATSGGVGSALPGLLVIIVIGIVSGLCNGIVVRGLKVNPIIATIGMMGMLSGLALIERPTPAGQISIDLQDSLYHQVGFMPIAFVVVAVIAIGLQLVLNRTGFGLRMRAVGFSDEASHRTGVNINAVKIGGFIACAAVGAIAGIFLGAQTGDGDPTVGANFALLSIEACVIGGASLKGGYGSFVGAVLASVFLTLLTNVTPLLQINDAYSQLITGALTILAVLAFSVSRWAAGARA